MRKKEEILFLMSIDSIGPKTIFKLLDMYEEMGSLLKDAGKSDMRLSFLQKKQLNAINSRNTHIRYEMILKYLEGGSSGFITFFDREYPDILRQIPDPPPGLFIRGKLDVKDNFSLAVVGTRTCDRYGRDVSETICRAAADMGITLVSGLARGIDTIAHLAAVRKKSRTIAVLGTAIDTMYPAENRALAYKIIENGAIISEFPPGVKTLPSNFILRNRIISGLSRAVIVTQAGDGSGALTTALNAADQNREVFAVPGPVSNDRYRGCHKLIKQGAKLVEDFDDVISEFPSLRERQSGQVNWVRQIDLSEFNEDEKRIMAVFQGRTLHVDMIQQSCGLSHGNILSSLLDLELKGYIKQFPGKLFKRTV